jgi:hypothetical protein
MHSSQVEVRAIVKRIQKLRTADGELYARLLYAAVFSTMEPLRLNDVLALVSMDLVVEDQSLLFYIPQQVVECVRYWGSPTPKVPSYMLLDVEVRSALKLTCFRSLEAVRELEKVARSPKPVPTTQQTFDDVKDRALLRGTCSDPLLPDEVRNFFNQFPEAAAAIPWLTPVNTEKRLDAWF